MLRRLIIALAVPAALALGACGQEGIELSQEDPLYRGAELFYLKCSGCHTLDAVGSEGSAVRANSSERKDGPNFNTRAEDYESVLYAIRNGGFSSGPMPQNIVVGEEARLVACFVAKYSGSEVARSESPAQPPSGSVPGGDTSPSQAPEETGENCPE